MSFSNNYITLASQSPRRSDLLSSANLRFEVYPAKVDEHPTHEEGAAAMALCNAKIKGEWVSQRLPGDFVLAADTTVVLDGTIFNKPRSIDEARGMLRKLSGHTHQVLTGVSLICHGLKLYWEGIESTQVTFKELSDDMIDAYYETVNPLDKSGAYAIQDGKAMIVDSYEGSLSNVIGLPMELLEKQLRTLELWDVFYGS